MSYNGIGLQSAKGSSTSGYVQRSIADRSGKRGGEFLRRKQQQENYKRAYEITERKTRFTADKAILAHDKKRQVEVKCMDLREQLEDNDEDLSDSEIDKRVDALRSSLLQEVDKTSVEADIRNISKADHSKQVRNERFREAVSNNSRQDQPLGPRRRSASPDEAKQFLQNLKINRSMY
ncbi:RNA-splicing factor [Komagataella phaffii CBS 7435]|uniref:Pre-mRNA-splicing factor CWC21 n=2 Tax=Komagataella phaffii TaxID=460519 RepID=C4QY99_KOMPG|nr:Hypothetical protein PAS_chr1-4_0377 [Komagataella phaffii GS115]AOA61449.1 GQ67_01790T0 [Komagataella phaffii]CAH2447044.1 RNA-splicing factor [Komagataella phaffii CBS 7435]AOA66660.1 GQ68_01805T0 [Komagataella phaffii GS115]CAY68222.1 Hypothetical protein PAS_chr1-4_0377 [Komagataella phaffii GS115]CCA37294.1 RNA-splicing factor [Komagataella phaffii CBS 7435]